MAHRECSDRHCGNNRRRKINRNSYDDVMGFLCDACEDAANAPEERCPVCEVLREYHDDVYPCNLDSQD